MAAGEVRGWVVKKLRARVRKGERIEEAIVAVGVDCGMEDEGEVGTR